MALPFVHSDPSWGTPRDLGKLRRTINLFEGGGPVTNISVVSPQNRIDTLLTIR